MRLMTLILLTSAMSGAALAQTPECRTIAEPAARLACYDKATPPPAAATAPKRAATPKSLADRSLPVKLRDGVARLFTPYL